MYMLGDCLDQAVQFLLFQPGIIEGDVFQNFSRIKKFRLDYC